MPKAFIFPGQGSQYVGMGSDFYSKSEKVRKLYRSAEKILGYNLAKISFNGPENKLNQTEFTQPAIFVHSVIMDDYLKNTGTNPEAVAGHSLGEFSALVSAGVVSFEDALQIIKVRSQSMADAEQVSPGTMAAIMGINNKQLKIICNQEGIVVPANINSPEQVVISGEIEAINNALITAKKLGIRKVIKLNVSGAFHSPLMQSAREPLKKVINSVNFNDTNTAIYQNVSPVENFEGEKVKQNLLKQLTSSVLWYDTIINMEKNNIDTIIEVGPKQVLSKLVQKISPQIKTISLDKLSDLVPNGFKINN